MDEFTLPKFQASDARLLNGEDILAALIYNIEHAKSKIWLSMFIVSLNPSIANIHRIKELLDALIRAKNRGLDVRIILGNFQSDYYDFNVNLQALHYLQQKGLSLKQFTSEYRQESHCKDWIFDDELQLTGSGNLTIGGLFSNQETFVQVKSMDLNRELSQRYNRIWESSMNIENVEI